MGILIKCEEYVSDLETINDSLLSTKQKLQETTDEIAKAKLWADEFNYAMQLSSVYEDLDILLDALEKEDGMKFIANKLRNKAKTFIQTVVIDV